MNDDRRLADLVGDALAPQPMDRTSRVAFRREVERRIEERSSPRWIGGLALERLYRNALMSYRLVMARKPV